MTRPHAVTPAAILMHAMQSLREWYNETPRREVAAFRYDAEHEALQDAYQILQEARESLPWLKIAFDPTMPGTCKVKRSMGARHHNAFGRWVVCDASEGYKDNGSPVRVLFDAARPEECNAWVRAHETITIVPPEESCNP